MEILPPILLAANEAKRFEIAGRYFEFREGTGRITVRLTGRSGEQGDPLRNIQAGDWVQAPFAGFEVTNADPTAQTVTLAVSRYSGGSRRIPRTQDADNGPAASAVSAEVANASTAAGTYLVTIVAPASNPNGLRVVRSAIDLNNPGAGLAQRANIVAQPSPGSAALVALWPATGMILCSSGRAAHTANGALAVAEVERPIRTVPPGWGVYAVHEISLGPVSNGQFALNYEAL